MAAVIDRTATDDVAAAIGAAHELERYLSETFAHLDRAVRQQPIEPGTLLAAQHPAGIAAALAEQICQHLRNARWRLSQTA